MAGFEYNKYIHPNLSNIGVPLFKGKNVQNSAVIYEFEAYIRVVHKSFGEGTIIKLEEGRIHVKFDDPNLNDAKIFQNPQAFENGFLKIK